MEETFKKTPRRAWATLKLSAQKFMHIDGGQRAAAFAYSAFFALFPIIVLFVTAASLFTSRGDAAGVVIAYVEKFVPLGGDMQHYVFDTVSRVLKARGQASAVALLMLVWVAAQFFTTLIQAANRAWGTSGANWWKLPLKSLALLLITSLAVLVGVGLPVLVKIVAGGLLKGGVFIPWAFRLLVGLATWLTAFLGLAFFYKLAPHRRTRYSEIWLSALCAALLLNAAQNLFVLYLRHFAAFNALYGAFGAIMALLLWIYISGVIFIFCACLGAAQAATRGQS